MIDKSTTIIEFQDGVSQNKTFNNQTKSVKIVGQIFLVEICEIYNQFPCLTILDMSDCDIVIRHRKSRSIIESMTNSATGKFVYTIITEFPNIRLFNSKIEILILPNSVNSISARAFQDSYSLKEIVLPADIKEIGESAFTNCKNLQKIVLPESINTIKPYTFSHCVSLFYINLPEAVRSIERYAFNKCLSLRVINGGTSLIFIDAYAFKDCNFIFNEQLLRRSSKNDLIYTNKISIFQEYTLGILVNESLIWSPQFGEIYCKTQNRPFLHGSIVCFPIFHEQILFKENGANCFFDNIRKTTDTVYFVLDTLNKLETNMSVSFSYTDSLKMIIKGSNKNIEFDKSSSDLIEFILCKPPVLNKQKMDILLEDSIKYVQSLDVTDAINSYSIILECHFRHKIGGDDTYSETYFYKSNISDIYLDTLLPNKTVKQSDSGYCTAESMQPQGTIEGHQVELEKKYKQSAIDNYDQQRHKEIIFNQLLKEEMNSIQNFYRLKERVYSKWSNDISSKIPFEKDISFDL